MVNSNLYRLIASIVICQLAGVVGSVFTAPSIPTWYATLQKPAFSPPNWIFAPVWTTLFLLMGISLYLVWKKGTKNKEVRLGISLFSIQLALNVIWSSLFFGLRSPFLAFIGIIVLWLAIALTIWQFHRLDKRAAWLLIPYIAWVTFAALLNYGIWVLN